jgi:hypothetical protein
MALQFKYLSQPTIAARSMYRLKRLEKCSPEKINLFHGKFVLQFSENMGKLLSPKEGRSESSLKGEITIRVGCEA